MKVWIIGVPGAGKTVLAARLARALGSPHHELDRYFWTRDWQVRPLPEFIAQVQQAVRAADWVVEGNYAAAAPLLQEKAALLVWVDVPFWVSYPRVLWRTGRALLGGQPVWEGNRETWRNALSKDGMPCYALLKHRRNRARLRAYWQAFPGRKVRLTHFQSVTREALQLCRAGGGGASGGEA